MFHLLLLRRQHFFAQVGQHLARGVHQRVVFDVARARQLALELALDAPRTRRHQQHPVAQHQRLAHVVRDEQDRLAGLRPDVLQLVVERVARLRVERGERLIHQQHLRLQRQRPRQSDALLHPAGKLVDERFLETAQSNQPQVLQSALSIRSARGTPAAANPNATLSCTLSQGNSAAS